MKNCTPQHCGTRCCGYEREMRTRAGGRSDQTVGDFMNAKCSQQFANLSAGTYVFADVRVYICKNAANRPTDSPATIHTRESLHLFLSRSLSWPPTKLRRRFCACQCYTLLKLLSYFQEKKIHGSSCYLAHWQSFL
jgi:hypothetical protein